MTPSCMMPFEIHIHKYPTSVLEPFLFTKEGVGLIDLHEPLHPAPQNNFRPISSFPFEKYTQEMHCRLMSIKSEEEAKRIMEEYSYLRFICDDLLPELNNERYKTIDEYLSIVLALMSQYREVIAFEQKYHMYCQNSSDDLLNDLVNQFNACHFLEPIRVFFNSPIQLYLQPNSQHIETRMQLEKNLGSLRVKENEFLRVMNTNNLFWYDYNNQCMVCHCNTILSAMYAYRSIDQFQKNTYQECANQNCHMLFLVDKSHPQTRCPAHMKVRQNKRKNYINKKKQQQMLDQ